MENKEQQDLMYKLSMYEQQIKHMQQQLQAVEQGTEEMISLNKGLEDLKSSNENEILAPIGRGIFAKAKLISKELTVDVGDKKFVKKSIPETQKIIVEQTKKLEDVKKELETGLEKINQEMTQMIMEVQGKGEK